MNHSSSTTFRGQTSRNYLGSPMSTYPEDKKNNVDVDVEGGLGIHSIRSSLATDEDGSKEGVYCETGLFLDTR
jgi:hypothetical protein